ncbi:MAG TPA: trehalose-6-phosphate synthase, partial [Planctomycetota bacterium]|nr:trehalose-6-phosphate synthase [Planctomycetota bacterium]
MTEPGLLAISNRLPELRSPSTPAGGRKRNVGGLVSALEPALAARRGLWLGWSGRTAPAAAAGAGQGLAVGVDSASEPPLAWVDLPEAWQRRYYNGFCNGALWPLLHSFPARARFSDDDWAAYVAANDAFADAARSLVGPATPVWIHDYHLLLLARALRRRGHTGPIGLFVHTPFPGPEIFGLNPWAEEIAAALLDLDLAGFHTRAYADAFRRVAVELAGAAPEGDALAS